MTGMIFDADRKARYLHSLMLTGQPNLSAQHAGVSPSCVKTHLTQDPDFKAAYDESMQNFREIIEVEIQRRALLGWDEPVYQLGEFVGTVRKHSDRMMELLAQRHIPEYKKNFTIDHNVSGGVLVVPGVLPVKQFEAKYTKVEGEDVTTKAICGSEPDGEAPG